MLSSLPAPHLILLTAPRILTTWMQACDLFPVPNTFGMADLRAWGMLRTTHKTRNSHKLGGNSAVIYV